jgi:hypothetical protein
MDVDGPRSAGIIDTSALDTSASPLPIRSTFEAAAAIVSTSEPEQHTLTSPSQEAAKRRSLSRAERSRSRAPVELSPTRERRAERSASGSRTRPHTGRRASSELSISSVRSFASATSSSSLSPCSSPRRRRHHPRHLHHQHEEEEEDEEQEQELGLTASLLPIEMSDSMLSTGSSHSSGSSGTSSEVMPVSPLADNDRAFLPVPIPIPIAVSSSTTSTTSSTASDIDSTESILLGRGRKPVKASLDTAAAAAVALASLSRSGSRSVSPSIATPVDADSTASGGPFSFLPMRFPDEVEAERGGAGMVDLEPEGLPVTSAMINRFVVERRDVSRGRKMYATVRDREALNNPMASGGSGMPHGATSSLSTCSSLSSSRDGRHASTGRIRGGAGASTGLPLDALDERRAWTSRRRSPSVSSSGFAQSHSHSRSLYRIRGVGGAGVTKGAGATLSSSSAASGSPWAIGDTDDALDRARDRYGPGRRTLKDLRRSGSSPPSKPSAPSFGMAWTPTVAVGDVTPLGGGLSNERPGLAVIVNGLGFLPGSVNRSVRSRSLDGDGGRRG